MTTDVSTAWNPDLVNPHDTPLGRCLEPSCPARFRDGRDRACSPDHWHNRWVSFDRTVDDGSGGQADDSNAIATLLSMTKPELPAKTDGQS